MLLCFMHAVDRILMHHPCSQYATSSDSHIISKAISRVWKTHELAMERIKIKLVAQHSRSGETE